jgi:hypothetical protein
MQVSWVKSEAEYFLIQGWTLICCVARRAQSPDRDASTNRAGGVAIKAGNAGFISVIVEIYIDACFSFQ